MSAAVILRSTALVMGLKNPIQVVILPLFTRDLAQRGERAAWESASVLMNSAVVLFVAAGAAGVLLAPSLVAVVAPGLGADTSRLAGLLARALMATLIFQGLAQFLSVLSYSNNRFGRPGFASTADNLMVILAVLGLAPWLGIHGLAIGAVLGTVAQVVTQLPIVWRHRALWRPRVDLRDPSLRRLAWLGLPLIIGTGGAGLGKISDRIFASLLPPGRLSALSYAHQLTYASFQLFAASLTTVLFPFLSRKAGVADYEDLGRKLTKAMTLLFAIVGPISVGIAVLHEPLVRLVYHRGAFTEESVRITAQPVLYYALGLAAYTLSHVLSYAFYSVQNTRTPVTTGFARFGVKVLLSFALVGPLGHGGLALAESLSFVVKTVLLFVLLPPELRSMDFGRLFRSFAVTAAASAAMALVIRAVLPLAGVIELGSAFATTFATLVAAAAVGAATYLVLAVLVNPVEVREAYRFVRSGVRGR